MRTATAVLDFLVEKFDVVLDEASRFLAGRAPSVAGQAGDNAAGLGLVLLGGAMTALAEAHRRQTARDIDSPQRLPGRGGRLDLALTPMLLLLGAVPFAYKLYTLLRRP